MWTLFLSVRPFLSAIKGVHLCVAQLFIKRNERKEILKKMIIMAQQFNNLFCFVIMMCFIYSPYSASQAQSQSRQQTQ